MTHQHEWSFGGELQRDTGRPILVKLHLSDSTRMALHISHNSNFTWRSVVYGRGRIFYLSCYRMQSVWQCFSCCFSLAGQWDWIPVKLTEQLPPGTMTDNLRDFAHHRLVLARIRLDLIYDGLIGDSS